MLGPINHFHSYLVGLDIIARGEMMKVETGKGVTEWESL